MTEDLRHRPTLNERRLILAVYYQGPWEKVSNFLWKVHKPDAVVVDGSLRDRLACWAEERDVAWRERYVMEKRRNPGDRWKRPSLKKRVISLYCETIPGAGVVPRV